MTALTAPLRIEPNPNPKAPLAAILHLASDAPVGGTLSVSNDWFRHQIAVPLQAARERQIAVVGMRPGVRHAIDVHLRGPNGPVPDQTLFYTPPALPEALSETPPFTITTADSTAMEPGFLLLSVRRRTVTRALWWTPRQKRFAQGWSLLVALDPQGAIIWTFHHDVRISGITRLANGNLFFHQVNHQSFEIDMLGNVVRSWVAAGRPAGPAAGAIPLAVQSLHHQPHQMPNGNFLAMAANTRTIAGYITSESDPDAPRVSKGVVGDRIIEFTPEGEIVWFWDSFDHLDPHRVGYHVLEPYWDTRGFPDHADWTHGNGVVHDPRDDGVVMSLKHQDAVLKVDRSGAIRWILGTHDGWSERFRHHLLQPVGTDFAWHWHGHNPRVTPQHTIVMYDNSILRARPYDRPEPPARCVARAVEYAVDEDAMTVEQVWASPDGPDDRVVCWAMGDAHRLPQTDNMLVIDSFCLPDDDPLDARGQIRKADLTWNERVRAEWHPSDFSYWARVREYRRGSRAVVFEARLEDPMGIMGWEIFGGAKTPALGPSTTEPTTGRTS